MLGIAGHCLRRDPSRRGLAKVATGAVRYLLGAWGLRMDG